MTSPLLASLSWMIPTSTKVCFYTIRKTAIPEHSSHLDGTFNPFGAYKFTGTMRPVYPLSPKRPVPEHIPRPEYAEDGTLKRILRAVPYAM